jgi:tRNA(Phe) wybutosine-synthesizing methylase Tyw3
MKCEENAANECSTCITANCGWRTVEFEKVENEDGYSNDMIDSPVQPIVDYINLMDGLETVGSCGGHVDAEYYQAKEGRFYVDFIGEHDDVESLVDYLTECEDDEPTDDNSLRVVMKATIFGAPYYRLEGKLETAFDMLMMED